MCKSRQPYRVCRGFHNRRRPLHRSVFTRWAWGNAWLARELGLPENQHLGKLLRWAHEGDLFTLAICHGPAALLAADDENPFIYNGYKITAFSDAVDKQTPAIGYIPGHMPWRFGEQLNALDVTIINTTADVSYRTDRRHIFSTSPKAANDFGRLAADTLLKAIH